MSPPSPLTLSLLNLLLLFTLFETSHSVTITLDGNLDAETIQICHDIPPGECCAAITLARYCYYNPFNPTSARFDNLQITDIAAVWGSDRDGGIRACSGIPIATRAGVAGTWDFPAVGPERAYGASYVRLPTRMPPQESESPWLEAEGLLGLVWGGGKWFSRRAAAAAIGSSVEGGLRRRGRGRRFVKGERGRAYCEGPRKWRWPDVVVANGTRFISARLGSLEFSSADGELLDVAEVGDRHC
ncbi:MAG: hypothetical protein HETSPECPRED_008782 [Heterodermia speciosa]|uniref:Uncharacterized protein n=1 Tax=Heterodermia speciosa TaxID=116794 RepID=A0A8H3IAC3_9LECA|nr:MAG: hypothetical protein HETSPECPRED_008782 [Heterodermia speciosa]